jgi:hypothetical protein
VLAGLNVREPVVLDRDRKLAYDLAAHLGEPDVDSMLAKMTEPQWVEWKTWLTLTERAS